MPADDHWLCLKSSLLQKKLVIFSLIPEYIPNCMGSTIWACVFWVRSASSFVPTMIEGVPVCMLV